MNSANSLRLVVINDEPEGRDHLLTRLYSHGFDVRAVDDGAGLDAALVRSPADIVVIDVEPHPEGLRIAGRLRENGIIGIVMLSIRGAAEDRILGLEAGADSYFVKPVNVTELAACLKNLGRRISGPATTPWRFSADESRLYTPNCVGVYLTSQECLLLRLLFANLGRTVSRSQIFSELGQSDDIYAHRRIEVMISRLRSKVQQADAGVTLPLRVRHNRGYVFLAERKQE